MGKYFSISLSVIALVSKLTGARNFISDKLCTRVSFWCPAFWRLYTLLPGILQTVVQLGMLLEILRMLYVVTNNAHKDAQKSTMELLGLRMLRFKPATTSLSACGTLKLLRVVSTETVRIMCVSPRMVMVQHMKSIKTAMLSLEDTVLCH